MLCFYKYKVNVRITVQLSKDLMDWVSRRLCYAVGDTDRFVSWTWGYSLIRRTCPGGDGVCTHVNSRRKALLYRDSNLQPDLSLDYKPNTLTNCAISAPQRGHYILQWRAFRPCPLLSEWVMLKFYTRTTQRYMPGGQLLLVEERSQPNGLRNHRPSLFKSTAKLSHVATGLRQA